LVPKRPGQRNAPGGKAWRVWSRKSGDLAPRSGELDSAICSEGQGTAFNPYELPGELSLKIGNTPVTDNRVPADSIVTITATVLPGVRLLCWDIAGGQTMSSTGNSLLIKVTGPMHVTAEFTSAN
jgi:hypothetical protein